MAGTTSIAAETMIGLAVSGTGPRPVRPDPGPRERTYAIVSVDDHFMEAPDLFDGRLPARWRDRAPRVVEGDDGLQYWDYDGVRTPVVGSDAQASWESTEWYAGPVRFDQVRPGMWDPAARVRDMDVAGIWGSLNFPSTSMGFAGQKFMRMRDHDLGLACMRAYNDWIHEVWCESFPDRFLPCQVTWLPDVELAADEVRRNAARGFTSVAFSENPEKLGFPSIHTGYWDPFLRACEETATVINLHIGSSSETLRPSSDSPLDVVSRLFNLNAVLASLDWLYAMIPVRFPGLKIVLSEAGIGWVPWLEDQIAYRADEKAVTYQDNRWGGLDVTPVEVFRRNFFFTTFWDPSGFKLVDDIGPDRVMVEVDYPHGDSTWPDSQEVLRRQLAGLPPDTVAQVTHGTACDVYRFGPPPASGW
jgi:predicted TIM-barrel fold metal-dependent hydrolase